LSRGTRGDNRLGPAWVASAPNCSKTGRLAMGNAGSPRAIGFPLQCSSSGSSRSIPVIYEVRERVCRHVVTLARQPPTRGLGHVQTPPGGLRASGRLRRRARGLPGPGRPWPAAHTGLPAAGASAPSGSPLHTLTGSSRARYCFVPAARRRGRAGLRRAAAVPACPAGCTRVHRPAHPYPRAESRRLPACTVAPRPRRAPVPGRRVAP